MRQEEIALSSMLVIASQEEDIPSSMLEGKGEATLLSSSAEVNGANSLLADLPPSQLDKISCIMDGEEQGTRKVAPDSNFMILTSIEREFLDMMLMLNPFEDKSKCD